MTYCNLVRDNETVPNFHEFSDADPLSASACWEIPRCNLAPGMKMVPRHFARIDILQDVVQMTILCQRLAGI